jgi:hypothetical protein
MPATSKPQQRLMGIALRAKREHKKNASAKVQKLMRSMSLKQLEEFAKKK